MTKGARQFHHEKLTTNYWYAPFIRQRRPARAGDRRRQHASPHRAIRPALLFLCAGFKANATTYSVTTCTDTMPDASGSPAGAGDGPGVSGDLRFSILQANSAGGTNTITRRVPLAAR
jgi:hypothetical protein